MKIFKNIILKSSFQIREYKTRSETEGVVDGGAAFAQESADIQERLARTYGGKCYNQRQIFELILSQGGNMDVFPEITFSAPDLHQDSIDGERTIDIVVA